MTTKEGEEACVAFFNRIKTEWKADPNNVIFKFVTSVEKKDVKDPAVWSVFKRRQRTKEGAEEPKNPCDDKGRPLFVSPSGELATAADGNEIAWGPWVDAIRGDVSTGTIAKSQRCHGERIKLRGGYYYSMNEKEIEDAIARDKAFHDKQQANRASKVAVDYKHELAKPESSHPEWICKVKKEKAREFPAAWESTKYSPLKAATDPIEIAFSYDKRVKNEKTGRYKTVHTGVGNFAGRKDVVKKIEEGRMFGMRALETNLKESGFNEIPYGMSSYPKFTTRVPGSDDICIVSTYREDFPYAANYFANKRLESESGKIYIGGMFRSARFEIGKLDPNTRMISEDKIHEYEEKAPKESVEFCRGKFNEVVKNSIIKLEEPKPE